MSSKRWSSQSEDEELEMKLKEAFDEVDVDRSGTVSKDELKLVFEKSGYQATEKAVQSILKDVDLDASGCIRFEEFALNYTRLRSKIQLIMDIQEQFREVDKDRSGFLTPDELRSALMENSEIGEDDVSQFLQEIDSDRDGKVSLQEWLDNFIGIYE